MKTQSKVQHRSPSRKSPRFSSPSSTHVSARSEPKTRVKAKSRPEYALALSLHVVEQVPLDACYPSDEDNKPIRRSSRFTANKYRTPPSEAAGPKSRPALTLTCGENVGPGEKRLLLLEYGEDAGRVRKRARVDPGQTVLRRSYRLKEGVKGNSAPTRLLALPESSGKAAKKCFLSEKCLRSRSVLMHKVEKASTKEHCYDLSLKCLSGPPLIKHASAKSREVKEKRLSTSGSSGKSRSKKSGGDFGVNGKTLRSEESGLALIEWSGSSRNIEMHSLSEKSTLSDKECSRSARSARRQLRKEMSEGGSSVIELPETSIYPRSRSKKSRKGHDGSSKSEKIAAASEEKRLELRNVEMHVQKESSEREGSELNENGLRSPKIESILNELFGATDEMDAENCDSDVQSEKCLKSRNVECEENTDEKYGKSTDGVERPGSSSRKGNAGKNVQESEGKEKKVVCCFVGEPIPEEEARKKWQWRYDLKSKKKGKGWKINADGEDEIVLNVSCHYAQARVGNCLLDIGDCVYVKGEGTKKHIGQILEFFKTTLGDDYFRVQWFFRAEDTVLKTTASSHDKRRLFYSTLTNDNLLDCIISKVNVVQIQPTVSLKSKNIQSAAFYYDMEYCVDYSTFRTLVEDIFELPTESQSLLSNLTCLDEKPITVMPLAVLPDIKSTEPELALLDLYSGCGGMSTGLCLGAKHSGVNLVTKWAVDSSSAACDSLRLNHPETRVRNESIDCFLKLLKHWEKLCKMYVSDLDRTLRCELEDPLEAEANTTQSAEEEPSGEYEVSRLVDICYGDPNDTGKCELHFKVRWKGYSPDDDTWEPINGLSNCRERIRDFVVKGFKSKILPLPGDADVICGGPPCQGISGYNRYRNFESPLADERNRQIIVFMDVVEFLKPRYALMENVTDIIRFDGGSLARYALSRIVRMRYQAKLGTAASACYGLPQFRLRVFIWAAAPSQRLPPFPLPTHDVASVRCWPPLEFERNLIAHDEGGPRLLEPPAVLRDSISDLPEVANDEAREEMAYDKPPETEFQSYLRSGSRGEILYDHRPLRLSETDYMRVCLVPRRKGASFRDFPGIVVGEDNVVRRVEGSVVLLPNGRPLVTDGVLNFEGGKSRRPYARVWWDETVSTIVTFPHVRAQAILHPEQDRLLTVRECARLQGFPDYYRFCGTIKERYRQIGNAVSVPVSRALGYALGMACRKAVGEGHLMSLPPKFCCQLDFCSGE
ncbi:DNA (cytosine-5)-methyltransferase CMT2 [Striga hermonthica]|uniref:DNA (cytosine-5-)-methyltransferase n=1 Tax=Striga hermonthica TaxID=68872 RepID=A0A9N7MZD9_STRHE|nr:DNA (cytosine-5)-methyltransferase CMT2 [Striga hermonthica]